MDLSHLLLWMIGANSLVLVLRSIVARRLNGWSVISIGMLIGLACSLYLSPGQTHLYVGIPWVSLIFVPLLLNAATAWLVTHHYYRLGIALANVVAWLHPWDNMWQQPNLIRAVRHLYRGEQEKARAILDSLKSDDSPLSTLARMLSSRVDGDWDGILAWIRASHAIERLNDATLIDVYLQALGETGQHQLMLDEFERLLILQKRVPDGFEMNTMSMRLAAYCGEVDIAEKLLSGPLNRLANDTRQFWIATAYQGAGQIAAAEEILGRLTQSPDKQLARRAEMRRSEPLATFPLEAHTPASDDIFHQMAETVGHESHFAVMSAPPSRRAPVTWLIILSLLIVFFFEIPGGATNEENMVGMGALIAPFSYTPGEYHRYVFAAFLHFGSLHLMMNIFGLMWFGQRLERAWGSLAMLACYLFTAVVAMVLFEPILELFTSFNPDEQAVVLVGASGGVMGLIGALLGHLILGAFVGSSPRVKRDLFGLGLIVILQTFFDVNSPEVSATVHLTGAALGFLFAMVYVPMTLRHARVLRRKAADAEYSDPPIAAVESPTT
ncbi:MAG: rhomboid family intramembrane serine protease [Planctomycetaceae bacterium]|nr:rhomboid family intramembrane serine protease [Planctomycetaceae bacterium]MCB9953309.1 rhomboid family intramembrane serine protease [Planctomycetaceae bacterium]